MHYIERLPFILGILAALTVGMLSFDTGIGQQALYMRMAISLVIFFFLGLYARSTILQIRKELDIKKAEENRKQPDEEERTTPVIDTRITDDYEFEPLKVNEILKKTGNTSTKEK